MNCAKHANSSKRNNPERESKMYSSFRRFCERLLRIPREPEPPPGDESTTRVFRASPNYFKYLVVLWAVQTAVVVVPICMVAGIFLAVASLLEKRSHSETLAVLIICLIVLLFVGLQRLFRLAVLRLDYEKRWYVVTDRSLRVREGVVTVQEMTITFANIQNISISQGPIQRILHVADLRVDTAGGGGEMGHASHSHHDLHTAWFRGIDSANEVRELIQQRLRHLKDSGLGDQEEVARELPNPLEAGEMVTALREVYQEAAALHAAIARNTEGMPGHTG